MGKTSAMSYVVLALRYRPQRFEEMVGQSAIATTLANAIRTGRLAQAYIFAGPRGTGKTSMARIFAKALNCEQGPTPEPCNQCDICRSIERGDDLDVLEIDAASNRGIDNVRELRDHVRYRPARTRFKIYSLDEAHRITGPAWNALLKTLEEPPEHVKFIFSTTAAEKMPETILSRCQRFDFRNLSTADIVTRLTQIAEAESIETAPAVLELIARRARGGMRDAISLLDQLHAASDRTITREAAIDLLGMLPTEAVTDLFQGFLDRDDAHILQLVTDAVSQGKDLGELMTQAIEHARILLHLQVLGDDPVLGALLPEQAERLRRQAQAFQVDHLLHAVEVLASARFQLRNVVDAQVLVEVALLELARLDELRPLSELASKVEALARKVTSASAAPPLASPASPSAPTTRAEQVGPLGQADLRTARGLWPELANQVDGVPGQTLTHLAPVAVSGDQLLVTWNDQEEPEDTSGLEGALQAAGVFLTTSLGRPVSVGLQPVVGGPPDDAPVEEQEEAPSRHRESASHRRRHPANDAIVQRAVELFEGTIEEGDA